MPQVIEILRSATRSRHARLASIPAMSRLLADDYSVAEYRSHLGRMLGLIEPLERAASLAAQAGRSEALPKRSGDLRADLFAMGATHAEMDGFERCGQIPSFSAAGLRGYSYVILGSMLGGRIIVRHLSAVLGARASFSFYGGGQSRYEAQWGSFCSDLETTPEQDVEAICATAIEIFDLYAAWWSQPIMDAREHV